MAAAACMPFSLLVSASAGLKKIVFGRGIFAVIFLTPTALAVIDKRTYSSRVAG